MNFSNPAWRRNPVRTAFRVSCSLVLKRRLSQRPLVVPFDDGRSSIHADLRTTLGLYLYRYGGCDHDRLLVRSFLKPGDVFADCGAHVGMFSLVAGRAVHPGGAVYAFEPSPSTYAQLVANLKLNALSHVITYREALGRIRGVQRFTVYPGDISGLSSAYPPDTVAEGREIEVEVAALAERIPENDWPRVALIKLDVEGAELDALEGAAPLIDASHPSLLMEFVPAHFERAGVDPSEVLSFLTSRGYVLLRPNPKPNVWAPCDLAGAMRLDVDRPNLLAATDLDVLRRRGVAIRESLPL